MPRHCSAGGCRSRDNRQSRDAGVTFHRLPKGARRRSLWITNSHRSDSWDPQTDFVYFCSKHFTPESFELTGCSGIRRLKEDAFPTVFDSSSTTKHKRAGKVHKELPVRRSLRPFNQGPTQQDGVPASEGPAGHRSGATPENKLEAAALAGTEPPSQQEHTPSSPPGSRPLSPSRFMRRLPPPPGFYLSKEHSYAQRCPLLWRRRYEQAVDCLEKALRQLHAARRREGRLRCSLLRLRDKQLKHTLLLSQDAVKNRAGQRRPGRGGPHPQEEEEKEEVDTGSCGDRCGEQVDSGGHFVPDRTPEQEAGPCSHCGRGQGHVRHWTSHTGLREDSAHDTKHAQSPGCVPSGDTSEAARQDLLQQLFWIQDGPEGHVLLVPVPAEDELRCFLQTDGGQSGPGGTGSDMGQVSCDGECGREDVREKLKEHVEGFHLQLSSDFIN